VKVIVKSMGDEGNSGQISDFWISKLGRNYRWRPSPWSGFKGEDMEVTVPPRKVSPWFPIFRIRHVSINGIISRRLVIRSERTKFEEWNWIILTRFTELCHECVEHTIKNSPTIHRNNSFFLGGELHLRTRWLPAKTPPDRSPDTSWELT
jgi:hypothetical protein